MSLIKLSDYIAKRLKEVHGVEHFFMVSGGGAMHLNDSLGRYIQYTACHNEQGCSISAEGYARVNQKMGLVNVTTGPGGLNCLNGVFGQWTDSVPVLYISGQVKYSTMMESCKDIKLRQLGDQEVDIISIVKPITKYCATVLNPLDIKYYLDKAVFEANNGRKGPVWLNIPMNVQSAMIDENKLNDFKPDVDSEKDVQKQSLDVKLQFLFDKLRSAKRPLIIAGHGIRLSGQIQNFYKLIEKLQIPVVTTFNGFDIMSDNDKFYIGRIGTIGQRAGNFALQNADLILSLGSRNNIRQVSYNWENFGKNAYKIAIDIDSAELEKPLVKFDYTICADLSEVIPLMLAFSINKYDEWLNFCHKLKNKYSYGYEQAHLQNNEEIINPYAFIRCLTEQMSEGDIFVMANGSACVCSFQSAVVKKNQRFILNSGDASMGYGLPAALGACYQACGRNVVCLEGDGSIMMNIQELQTMVHNNLPVKLFIINNNGYSSIRQTQKNFFNGNMTGSGVDSGVSVPDFLKVGKAFGLNTVRISKPSCMKSEINDVLSMNEPVLCEVMTEQEYSFSPKLSSRKLPDGSMLSPSLEDMYPFLSRKEYNENMLNIFNNN